MKKMKKGWKITLIIIASLLVLLVLGPLVIPIPPAKNTQPVQAFTDADSQFVEINGLNVHYKMAGAGNPVFILLHGFGASTFSWREVIEPFSNYGTVIAYDRPAFGLTERPVTWEGENPYSMESNVAILLGLMDAMGVEEAILVGNSAGGTVATAFTLAHPGRVQALIEVDAAIYQTMPDSPLLTWFLNTPQMDRLGPLVARWAANRQADAFLASAWYDTVILEQNPQIIEGYFIPFEVDHWDRALWEHTQVTRSPDLADRLDEIEVPTLVISGQYDQIVPLELSQQLAADIPGATLTVLPNCGHLPQEECPGAFLAAIDNFLVEMERTNE
jgi:pimeloyl-ACP methyl ester carboxylesterase